MNYRVMVLIPHPYEDRADESGRRWVEADDDCPSRGAAAQKAWGYLQQGYSPSIGEIYRVDATHVEAVS